MKLKNNHLAGYLTSVLMLLSGLLSPLLAQTSADETANDGVGAAPATGPASIQDYQADLFTGRFSYKIPIKVAPARQGSEPKLALGYNSAFGNGWCGVGWSLDTAYIQRDTRHGVPILWGSGSSPLTQYDDSKGFVANFGGAQSTLVQISVAGSNPMVFRQQVDTAFLTYNRFTDNHWEVVDKSGTTMYFGEGPTNRMSNPKTGWSSGALSGTFRWVLDKVVDTNGNATYFRYATDNGAIYLTNIVYNANITSPALPATGEIDFLLTTRADQSISFLSGYRVQTEKLLYEIDVKAAGANVRKYSLTYVPSGSTTRSLLASVTEYGSDYSTALPPITFSYQSLPGWDNQFSDATPWPGLYSQGKTRNQDWNSIRAYDGADDYFVTMADIDGDGLPDRVMRKADAPFSNFIVQRNTGSGFAPVAGYYQWGPLTNPDAQIGSQYNSPQENTFSGRTDVDLIDMNGDGYVDRVAAKVLSPYNEWYVQTNTGAQGTGGFSSPLDWNVIAEAGVNSRWLTLRYQNLPSERTAGNVTILDMNGDGLPDRVMSKFSAPFDRFKVQLNTGNNFASSSVDWATLDSQTNTTTEWNDMSYRDTTGNWQTILMDINGDGLPDRVMRPIKPNASSCAFYVQFNNGAGFEPEEPWGPVDNYGSSSDEWNSPIGTDREDGVTTATLIDVNGDGLPDRVMEVNTGPYTMWNVYFNTGSGFVSSPYGWGPIERPGMPSSSSAGEIFGAISQSYAKDTAIDFFDINGDGLPDRIICTNLTTKYDFTQWMVQTNKGPFPDLMCGINNGIGGSVQVTYTPSTSLDNRDRNWTVDPWNAGAKSLLPFNVWVVNTVATSDGMGNSYTNSYAFKGGYYNPTEREFRGFSQCTMTDPLKTKTITYFHQSGGRDNSALGEYNDQSSESKKGIPFRIDLIGSDFMTYKTTLNKVDETQMGTGWYFPHVSQTITMDYEGLSTYRATAKQFTYDSYENLKEVANLGEVTNVVVNGQTFTDTPANDSIYTWLTYTPIGTILNRPNDVLITSDSTGSQRLQETSNTFDGHGNLLTSQSWLNTASQFITSVTDTYDGYGNLQTTKDAANITTSIAYDSTYQQFPITKTTGSFVSSATFNILSGLVASSTDVKGLVSSNSYDIFFRPTSNYISTAAFGVPNLWVGSTYYFLNGIRNNCTTNYIRTVVNNVVDPKGFESYTYFDGLSRETVQTRTEAETGQFRVANTAYGLRGSPCFTTLPYFSPGTNFTILTGNTNLGSFTEYDAIGTGVPKHACRKTEHLTLMGSLPAAVQRVATLMVTQSLSPRWLSLPSLF